jgi:S-adenosylhomocysteine hydrolase
MPCYACSLVIAEVDKVESFYLKTVDNLAKQVDVLLLGEAGLQTSAGDTGSGSSSKLSSSQHRDSYSMNSPNTAAAAAAADGYGATSISNSEHNSAGTADSDTGNAVTVIALLDIYCSSTRFMVSLFSWV